MPMLEPKIYIACSLVCPMPTSIMGTTRAITEFTMLEEARTKVMGTEEAIRGTIFPLGEAILPLPEK